MDNNLEQLRSEKYGKGPKDQRELIPLWGCLPILMTGLERPWPDDEDAMAEAEKAGYWSKLQPKLSWYSGARGSAGRRLIALGQRLEARGSGKLSLQPGSSH